MSKNWVGRLTKQSLLLLLILLSSLACAKELINQPKDNYEFLSNENTTEIDYDPQLLGSWYHDCRLMPTDEDDGFNMSYTSSYRFDKNFIHVQTQVYYGEGCKKLVNKVEITYKYYIRKIPNKDFKRIQAKYVKHTSMLQAPRDEFVKCDIDIYKVKNNALYVGTRYKSGRYTFDTPPFKKR